MPHEINFFVPIKIVSEANASFSRNWWEKTARKNKQLIALKVAMQDIKEYPTPCEVTLSRSGSRMLDYDNLVYAFKAIRDHVAFEVISKIDNLASNLALVDKKVNKGRYDSDPRILWSYKQEKGETGFWIRIKEIT